MKLCKHCSSELTPFRTRPQYSYCRPCNLKRSKEKNKLLRLDPEYRLAEHRRNSEYVKKRMKVDPIFKLKRNLRIRLNKALHRKTKTGSAVSDLGCSIEELKLNLEKQFQPGMSWENYGFWEIDHIKALSTFDLSNREELLKACHYTNLQPLWKKDNIIKGVK